MIKLTAEQELAKAEIEEMLRLKPGGIEVITTSEMSEEEELFELTVGFLKEGYDYKTAVKEAKKAREMMYSIFEPNN